MNSWRLRSLAIHIHGVFGLLEFVFKLEYVADVMLIEQTIHISSNRKQSITYTKYNT
jgi:hypothetical protein